MRSINLYHCSEKRTLSFKRLFARSELVITYLYINPDKLFTSTIFGFKTPHHNQYFFLSGKLCFFSPMKKKSWVSYRSYILHIYGGGKSNTPFIDNLVTSELGKIFLCQGLHRTFFLATIHPFSTVLLTLLQCLLLLS